MKIRKINDEVIYCEDQIVLVDYEDIQGLKGSARHNERKRVRICAHREESDRLHEMIIVHTKDTYVRPHRHFGKSESFLIIDGLAKIIIFSDNGNIQNVIEMGDYLSKRIFYYRICEPLYHTLLIESDVIVFHESTNGPFNRGDNDFAPWSPDEKDAMSCSDYLSKLHEQIGV